MRRPHRRSGRLSQLKCHTGCPWKPRKAEVLVEGSRIGARWAHNEGTDTREACNLHRVLHGIAKQRRTQTEAPLAAKRISEQFSRELLIKSRFDRCSRKDGILSCSERAFAAGAVPAGAGGHFGRYGDEKQ